MRTISSQNSAAPSGVYPTGWAGTCRTWDGADWEGPAIPSPETPAVFARHTFLGYLRAHALWVAILGYFIGVTVAMLGSSIPLLRTLGGAIGAAGPMCAVLIIIRKRLGTSLVAPRSVYVWGILAGALGAVLAALLEMPFSGTASNLVVGPIEEGSKLLVPFALLLVGQRIYSDPRVGIWLMAISAGAFGVLEAAEYVYLSHEINGAVITQRPWIELLHVFATTGAAALIWRAAHRQGRAFTLLGLAGYAGAAIIHSTNDSVESLTVGLWTNAYIAILFLTYFFWFRPLVRQSVPPTTLQIVPKSWLPRLPRKG